MVDQVITFNFASSGSQTVAETKKVRKELEDLDAATQKMSGVRSTANQEAAASANQSNEASQSAGLGVAALAAKYYLVMQALQAVMAVGQQVYGSLIAQNVELEAQLLSTQSSLAATNKVVVGGVEVQDPTEAIQALEGPVNEAIKKIREGSLDLVGVTSQQLIPIFQNIAGQSGQIGASLDDAAALTLKFAAAMGTLQIPLEQQRQEINSIIQGQITSDSTLAKTLGINNEMVRSWKAQGTVVEELNARLATFAAGNKLAAQTIGGVASNIQEVFDNITLEAGGELTKTIANDLNDLYQLLVDNKDEILAFVQAGVDFFTGLYKSGKEAADALKDNLAPVLEGFGNVFDEDLLNTIDLVFNGLLKGFVALAESALDNPAIGALLRIVDAGVLAVGALANLGGAYSESTEAAEIYRQQSAKVTQGAVDALAATKRGETDAAKARKEAIAQIDDQLKALRESNLVGTENKAVVRAQIQELEGWKDKLGSAGGGVQLVSKDTTQLTNDLKRLNEQFEQNSASAEAATTALKSAVQRNLAAGEISARQAQRQTLEIERQGLEERLELNRDKIAEIEALKAKGGDAEQQKEFGKQLTAAQKAGAETEIAIAQNKINQRKELESQALKEVEKITQSSADTIAQIELEKQVDIQKALNDGILTEEQAALRKLGITRSRIQAEIQAEQDNANRLSALKFADPAEQEANEAKIRASKRRTAQLNLQLLQNQREVELSISKAIQRAIQDRADEERNQSQARQQQLTEQLNAQELLNNSLDRQGKLLKAQQDLASAQGNLQTISGQIEIDNLNRALEIRKKLNEANLDPEVRRVLSDQLKSLTGRRDTSEARILAERVQRENELAQIKRQTLAAEQQAARASLELELQRNDLAARRLVIETQNARLSAQQFLADAQTNLDKLAQDPTATDQQRRNAQAAVDRAQSNVALADRTATDAETNLAQQDRLTAYARATLAVQQKAAIAQFEAADYAREQANQLALAEKHAQGIARALRENGSQLQTPTANDFLRRNQRLAPQAQPVYNAATAPNPAYTATPANGGSSESSLAPLQQLVNLMMQQNQKSNEANGHLAAIASRRPVERIEKTTINNQYTTRSSQGLPR
jgi:hypothetical protein